VQVWDKDFTYKRVKSLRDTTPITINRVREILTNVGWSQIIRKSKVKVKHTKDNL